MRGQQTPALFEKLGVCPDPREDDAGVVGLVNQEEITTDVAFAEAFPLLSSEGVIFPFGPERAVIGDEQEHDLLQPAHVIAPALREPVPVLQEMFRVIETQRGVGALLSLCRLLFRCHQASSQRWSNDAAGRH